jgi:niacin transporter
MNKMRKRLSLLTTAALLTALAILIPQVMPKIVIPPASFTLASHVPIMIGMLISPAVAVVVSLGSTLGFLISGLPIEITFRAATHVIFALIGSLFLWKHRDYTQGLKFQLFNVVIAIIHTLAEVAIIYLLLTTGFSHLDGRNLSSLLLVLGIGGFIHSLIDFNIALFLARAIHKVYPFDIFKK